MCYSALSKRWCLPRHCAFRLVIIQRTFCEFTPPALLMIMQLCEVGRLVNAKGHPPEAVASLVHCHWVRPH